MGQGSLKMLLVEDSASDAVWWQEALEQEEPGAFQFLRAESWAQALV